jgi:hypothetical protein
MRRKEYIESTDLATKDRCAAIHHKYYSQFVTEKNRKDVILYIGWSKLLNSNDTYFNDTTCMREWDDIPMRTTKLFKKLNYPYCSMSPSDKVCILKAAAIDLVRVYRYIESIERIKVYQYLSVMIPKA